MSKLRHLRPGSPLTEGPQSAGCWNQLVDAQRYVEQLRRDGPNARPIPLFADRTMVRVKNASGAARNRFGVLGISDSIISPSTSLGLFQSQISVEGDTPAVPADCGKFVVLAQPLASGRIGWGWIAGVCVVQVDFDYSDQPYADVKNSDAGLLEAGEGGAAQILWKESGTGSLWSIVRLGVPWYPTLRGKLDGNLNAGSSAVMSVWAGDPLADTGRNVTVYDSSTLGFLNAGKKIASTSPITAAWTSGKWNLQTPKGCEVAQ